MIYRVLLPHPLPTSNSAHEREDVLLQTYMGTYLEHIVAV